MEPLTLLCGALALIGGGGYVTLASGNSDFVAFVSGGFVLFFMAISAAFRGDNAKR